MKRMKKLICALAAISVLMINANPASAKFAGTLRSDLPWSLEFSPELANTPAAAVTIIFVDSRGRQDIDMFTLRPGELFNAYVASIIPRGTRRIIIEMDSRAEALFRVRVTQGSNVTSENACCEFSRIVFDVV